MNHKDPYDTTYDWIKYFEIFFICISLFIMMVEKKIHNLFINEFTRFPKSEVQDYYKLLYQALYGAEHMVQNYNDSFKMLDKEMSQTEADINCSFYHDISLSYPLVRVNLSRCKAENIDPQRISTAFFDGAKINSKIDAIEFETYLKLAAIELIKHPFNFTEENLEVFIRKIKKLGFPTVHHSEFYNKTYNPHYRVIPLEIWEKKISKDFHNL